MKNNINVRNMTAEEINEIPRLELDDSFEFTCKACGKCCKNRTDLLITPYDLFRIAVFLGHTPQEVFERYCYCTQGHSSRLPLVLIKPLAPDNHCPFLRGKKCSIHAAKPGICSLYPLARIGNKTEGVSFFYSGANCNHPPKKVTVREWIGNVAAEESNLVWNRNITFLSKSEIISTAHSHIHNEELWNGILSMILCHYYLDYDIESPFFSQFQEKCTYLENGIFEKLKQGVEQYFGTE